jgi:probable rRNA maturation factor
MSELTVRNRQRAHKIDMRPLRQIALFLIEDQLGLGDYELGVFFLDSGAMARLNKKHLGHEGPTDVITFGYSAPQPALQGDIVICPQVAEAQARQFGTTGAEELVRYLAHGLLHLLGFDDIDPSDRKKMKVEERTSW